MSILETSIKAITLLLMTTIEMVLITLIIISFPNEKIEYFELTVNLNIHKQWFEEPHRL